ncbi:histone family protein nucleoid-structuring protein H-NS [Caballeronia calidae]|uniref:Histone family protein nucleoid-structuring protein H-NS n=1 Tax=Caballeronia calidae TaxID=1777139 RepID=A0A158E3T8_9BURK|nr:H-NS histone family protein [Caballeronia calidae]SAL01443.1 histone family protein nucleoid-structuring protein H-NS [Caballeronia calidae]
MNSVPPDLLSLLYRWRDYSGLSDDPCAWIREITQTDSGFASVVSRLMNRSTVYRDPVSGLTWNGFGRAPGWIATAKDRSAFLIEGSGAAGERGEPTNAVAEKGVAAKESETEAVTPEKAKSTVKKAGASNTTVAKKATAKKTTAAGCASVAVDRLLRKPCLNFVRMRVDELLCGGVPVVRRITVELN